MTRTKWSAFKLGFAALLVAALSVFAFAPASAHDQLVSSNPEDGAELDQQPEWLEMTFSGNIQEVGSEVTVVVDGKERHARPVSSPSRARSSAWRCPMISNPATIRSPGVWCPRTVTRSPVTTTSQSMTPRALAVLYEQCLEGRTRRRRRRRAQQGHRRARRDRRIDRKRFRHVDPDDRAARCWWPGHHRHRRPPHAPQGPGPARHQERRLGRRSEARLRFAAQRHSSDEPMAEAPEARASGASLHRRTVRAGLDRRGGRGIEPDRDAVVLQG